MMENLVLSENKRKILFSTAESKTEQTKGSI